jgi:hypothetical protein
VRRQITLGEIVSAAQDSQRATLYHVMPGHVLAYHKGAPGVPATVDVQAAVNDVRFALDTGARFSEPWTMIPKVSVMWLSFGPFILTGALHPGDRVILFGFDLDPSAWQKTGEVSDPPDTRRHSGSYWCAFPCDLTVPGAFVDGAAAEHNLVLGVDGGDAQIRIPDDGSAIVLGKGATQFVALANKVDAQLAAIAATLGSLTGSAHFATPYVPGEVAAALVKAK